jgi:hypothetical protein
VSLLSSRHASVLGHEMWAREGFDLGNGLEVAPGSTIAAALDCRATGVRFSSGPDEGSFEHRAPLSKRWSSQASSAVSPASRDRPGAGTPLTGSRGGRCGSGARHATPQTIWNDRLAVVRSRFSREKATVADRPPRSIAG